MLLLASQTVSSGVGDAIKGMVELYWPPVSSIMLDSIKCLHLAPGTLKNIVENPEKISKSSLINHMQDKIYGNAMKTTSMADKKNGITCRLFLNHRSIGSRAFENISRNKFICLRKTHKEKLSKQSSAP